MKTRTKAAWKLLLIIIMILFFGYTALFGLGSEKAGSLSTIKLGLELKGGVSITYQSVKDEPTSEEMKDAVYKLQKKAEAFSSEAEVYQEGKNRINIDIPGVDDADAVLKKLGRVGQLKFTDSSGTVLLTGDDVANAQASAYEESGIRKIGVSLTFTAEGSEKFAKATSDNVGKNIAIRYDDEVLSNPVVNQAIRNGNAQITGNFDYDSASELATAIRAGALPIELEEVRSNIVGAKLGSEAIDTSLIAGAIGLAIVMIFMIVVFKVPGIAADLGLLMYIGVVVMLLSGFEVTLTLPGIAGMILGIGMAVDANCIIFARIREEIGLGKSPRNAIKLGFSKALSAILDGNITTLIAAAVLYLFGSGTIMGFAFTLAIGIVVSLFTALVITRVSLYALHDLKFDDEKFYGRTENKKTFEFIGKKKICFLVSGLLILVGIIAMIIGSANGSAFNYSLEFVGGTSTTVTLNENMDLSEIHEKILPPVEKITGDANVMANKVAGTNEIIIKTRTLNEDERASMNDLFEKDFGVSEKSILSENISATVGTEMRNDALKAIIISAVCMLIYLAIRFRNIKFGLGAVLALVHDILILVGCYAVFRWSVGNTFIACVLTIVGYSVNATIVIYDRIREERNAFNDKKPVSEIIDGAISHTLTRSIDTSLTTLIMVIVLYIVGVTSIKEFALPLMIGIVCGTYSSVFLAGSIWYVLERKKVRKQKTDIAK